MRGKTVTILCIGLLFSFLNTSTAQQKKEITCTGKVVDSQDKPIAEAKVTLYGRVYDKDSDSYDMELAKEAVTNADGMFSISVSAEINGSSYAYMIAEADKLAPGWAYWNMREDKDFEIKLSQVGELSGFVIDENDKPVEQAEVSVYMLRIGGGNSRQYLSGQLASKLYTIHTDNTGRFTFTNVPVDAKADLLVRKPGRATITTYINSQDLHYSPGDDDIRLVQPVEAKIEGIFVEKDSGKPVAGQKLILMQDWNRPLHGHETVSSKEDGTFSINGLGAGRCILQLVTPREGLARWVADPVEVMTEAGKTKSDVKIELCKGGILEVVVKDAGDKKSLENASVNIQEQRNNMSYRTRSDENGIARIRLVPGEYRISSIYVKGFTSDRNSQNTFTIEADKTEHLECELTGVPKITGIVRDDKDEPLGDVKFSIWPFGFQEFTSDTNGKFEFDWNPIPVPFGSGTMYYLIGRHEGKNLAIGSKLDMEAKTIDIKLQPGVIITGKVADPNGEPIKGADIMLHLIFSNMGTSLGRNSKQTDTEGKFEIRAVPAGLNYSINARAEGYSQITKQIDIEQAIDNQLDIGTLTLLVANLMVSGVIVDEDDKPVANAGVFSSGQNQPQDITQTGTDGKFVIKACGGRIRINANTTGRTRMSGSIETEGGATDVKIVISERSSSRRYVPIQSPSLVHKPLPDIKNLDVQIPQADIENKMMLVCFFDMNQRPSRNCLLQLSKRAQELKAKDIVLVGVQASKIEKNSLEEWIKSSNISFPVGMIQGDEQKSRFAWGVRALPWLILTDKNHIVISNGFAINELDEKINQIQ